MKNSKIDLKIAALFMLFHLIMVNNMQYNMDNFIYHEMTILMGLAGWGFLGRFLWVQYKNSKV